MYSIRNSENPFKNVVLKAIQHFDLHLHHETIHDNPNELIDAGFPADFLQPLITVFKSTQEYLYFRNGSFVNEMIGISHLALVFAIGDCLGIPKDIGIGYTGRGFTMNAVIEAIIELCPNSYNEDE